MNREFKFRLWSKSEKCFVNPNILEVWDESGNMTPFQFVKTGKLDPIYMPVENYVIQQFTGLKDAKGNPIYEGDILQFSDEDKGNEPCEVIYELGMFGCNIIDTSNNKDFWQLYYIVTKLKPIVIGNIFENSDLIK